jgi:hypothetical protein
MGIRGRAGSANLLDGRSSIAGFLGRIGALALIERRNRRYLRAARAGSRQATGSSG